MAIATGYRLSKMVDNTCYCKMVFSIHCMVLKWKIWPLNVVWGFKKFQHAVLIFNIFIQMHCVLSCNKFILKPQKFLPRLWKYTCMLLSEYMVKLYLQSVPSLLTLSSPCSLCIDLFSFCKVPHHQDSHTAHSSIITTVTQLRTLAQIFCESSPQICTVTPWN